MKSSIHYIIIYIYLIYNSANWSGSIEINLWKLLAIFISFWSVLSSSILVFFTPGFKRKQQQQKDIYTIIKTKMVWTDSKLDNINEINACFPMRFKNLAEPFPFSKVGTGVIKTVN